MEVSKNWDLWQTLQNIKRKEKEVIAYDDLGAEALRRLEVENLPAFVIIDSEGNNLYEIGRKEYLEFANK